MAAETNVRLDGVKILPGQWRNFAGAKTLYRVAGERRFNILLPEDIGRKMAEDGWLIKWLEPRDDQDPLMARLEVKVMFGQYPPNINILKPGKRIRLSEANVGILDTAVITEADVIIRPYNWMVNGKSGVAAYLVSLFAHVQVDELEEKYSSYGVDYESEGPDGYDA